MFLKAAALTATVPGADVFTQTFSPALPPTLSLHLQISDAALVLTTRTLQFMNASTAASGTSTPTSLSDPSASFTGFSLRDKLFGLGPKLPNHDEMGETFPYRGMEVQVREKVRVESMDPSLMSVMAKLSALEHEVGRLRECLRVLMGEDESDA